jgi:hypothetical protein|nr:MAG TPA: tail collar domain [Caudoviricetes sp.]
MANLKENAAWESGIYQLETTDPVVGGVDGISNKQAIQLANRTSYLKGEIESLKSNSNAQLVLKRDISDSYSKTQTAALIAPKLDSAIAEATYLKKTDKIDAYTKRESDDKFALKTELTDGLPIGAYLSYPSQKTIPAGFLLADGRSLKKSEYTELFDVIGYTYGGSGQNFNLPNFADGKFMRSIGGKAAPLGTAQQDELKSHIHNVSVNTDSYGNSTATLARGKTEVNNNESGFIKSTGGNETRPYNMAVVVIIKAKNVNTPTAGQIDKTILATEAKSGIVKLKNSITAKQEDAAITEKAVSDAIEANKSIGIGQTYQDVWAQRDLNTYYPNTTGRPIMVGVDFEPILVDTPISVVIDDQIVRTAGIDSHIHVGFSFVVPAGSKYKIATLLNTSLKKINLVADVTNKKYNTWNELK